LGKWRILSLEKLKTKVNYHASHQAFSKLVRKLEQNKYLESIYYQNYRKYLFLTDKGLRAAGLNESWQINKEIILHDLISVNVLENLMQDERFKSGELTLIDKGQRSRPDGEIRLLNGDDLFLEIELTQKSKPRVRNKIREYQLSWQKGFVFYVFSSPSVFKAYKKIINELDLNSSPLSKKRIANFVILMLEPAIKNNNFSLENSNCYFDGKFMTFSQLKDQYLS
tara:strand:- start:14159 stop:14833 length:675 start_codon:yes stop_codon:yes gene_type:complete